MTIVVTGSSGFLGSALVHMLRAGGVRVLRLVRREPTGPDEAFWDPLRDLLDPVVLEGARAVIHLGGAGIADQRWTESYKRQLVDTRVIGAHTLVEALGALKNRPPVLLSSSAVGYYGDTGDREVDESSPAGTGFLADLVRDWEAAVAPAEQLGVRVVQLRTGIVLSGSGGALAKVLPMFKLGLGTPLGSGRQYVSWISLPDWLSAVQFLMTNSEISGPVNLTAPRSVTNTQYTKAIGRALHRPTIPIPTPAIALRLALGEFADEGVLAGQRVVPRRLLEAGHVFSHPTLEEALAAVL